MPVPSEIAGAAIAFRQNAEMIEKSFKDLSTEEWTKRPNDSSNSLLWVIAHVVWARSRTLAFLGIEWSRPWLDQFGRGSKAGDTAGHPTPEEVVLAWQNVGERLTSELETASQETLSAPAPPRMPTYDGKISGLVNFLAWHETYHVGQAAYLRCWLGHEGVAG
jgi:uncharacterized damage-inducible protein DinB